MLISTTTLLYFILLFILWYDLWCACAAICSYLTSNRFPVFQSHFTFLPYQMLMRSHMVQCCSWIISIQKMSERTNGVHWLCILSNNVTCVTCLLLININNIIVSVSIVAGGMTVTILSMLCCMHGLARRIQGVETLDRRSVSSGSILLACVATWSNPGTLPPCSTSSNSSSPLSMSSRMWRMSSTPFRAWNWILLVPAHLQRTVDTVTSDDTSLTHMVHTLGPMARARQHSDGPVFSK